MAFTKQQIRQLKAKLDGKLVRTRTNNGLGLSYIEGWHAIAEANRIFGHDGWDRETVANTCIHNHTSGSQYQAAYTAKVRVTVRAQDSLVVREGSGTGEGTARSPGQAHELALKAAETDATKRALATFGDPFGLALYRGHSSAHKTTNLPRTNGSSVGPWTLHRSVKGETARFDEPEKFVAALRPELSGTTSIEALFELWEANVHTVRGLNQIAKETGKGGGVAQELVTHLKNCASALAKSTQHECATTDAATTQDVKPDDRRGKIDKSVLTLSEPKRFRSKEHLRYVARQPCVICGRSPSQAHHIRYAQPRGLGIKVSDEFTVPLCAIHRTENHATGNEKAWWQERNVEPLSIADKLWRESRTNTAAIGG